MNKGGSCRELGAGSRVFRGSPAPLGVCPWSVCLCEGPWKGPISGDGKSSELLMVFVVISSANDWNQSHCNNVCNESSSNELLDPL